MSFQGEFLKAGIDSDGTNVDVFKSGAQFMVDGPTFKKVTVTTKTTASDVTYTAAELIGGLIIRDPSGGARTDTSPTAVLLAAAIKRLNIGSSFLFVIRNSADAAETITLAGGIGVALATGNTNTIVQNNSKTFLAVCTAIGAAPTFTIYSLGTVVH